MEVKVSQLLVEDPRMMVDLGYLWRTEGLFLDVKFGVLESYVVLSKTCDFALELLNIKERRKVEM